MTDNFDLRKYLSNNKFITFKLEIIDNQTKEVLKEIGKFTLDRKIGGKTSRSAANLIASLIT